MATSGLVTTVLLAIAAALAGLAMKRPRVYQQLYLWVLAACVVGSTGVSAYTLGLSAARIAVTPVVGGEKIVAVGQAIDSVSLGGIWLGAPYIFMFYLIILLVISHLVENDDRARASAAVKSDNNG